jgi:FkbM family methyltransferase
MPEDPIMSPRSSYRRPLRAALLAAVCLGLLLGIAGVFRPAVQTPAAGPPAEDLELEPLQKYGPHKFSRNFEEWIIRDHFQDRRDGVFLDVGANHYRNESNTYYLEKELGWSGLAIDALSEFGDDYRTHRPRTRFLAMFASDQAGSAQLFVPERNKLIASKDPEFIRRHGETGTAREVPATTLDHALQEAGISRLDFMSMDIELAEPKALAGFDIDRFKPALVCIEAHPEVRQQILDYFTRHRYVVIGKYLRVDQHNLYFQPLSTSVPEQ